MTLQQKFQNEIETESTASLNLGHVPSWGVLIFGEGQPRLVRPLPVTLPNRAKLQRHAIPRNIEKELAVSTRPVAQLVRALS